MKNLNNIILTASLILVSFFSFAQEQETVTLVCSKNLHGATDVVLDLNGTVTTSFWDKDYVRITIQIKSNGISKEVIRYLMTQKRFNVSGMRVSDYIFEISMPNIELPAFINGQKIQEEVSYHVILPHYTLAEQHTDLIAMSTEE